MYKLGFKEVEEPETKLPTSVGSQKNIYFFTDYAKAFNCVGHKKTVENSTKEMEVPDHITSLLRNLYFSQEATVKIGHRNN